MSKEDDPPQPGSVLKLRALRLHWKVLESQEDLPNQKARSAAAASILSRDLGQLPIPPCFLSDRTVEPNIKIQALADHQLGLERARERVARHGAQMNVVARRDAEELIDRRRQTVEILQRDARPLRNA